MRKLILLLFLITVAAFNARAAEQLMVKVENNDPDETETFAMIVETKDDGEILAFHKDSFSRKTGVRTERKSYRLSNIEAGYVLDHRRDRDIIKLAATTFDSYEGGELVLTYLYDGRFKIEKESHLKLKYQDNQWSLFTEAGERVQKMFFRVRKMVAVGIFGVKLEINP